VDVHVNHPLYDLNTPGVAAGVYTGCRCRALIMAGTHRYANADDESDMARSTTSLFQALHEALAGEGGMMSISVHGFARSNHSPPTSESDAVLSNGATSGGDQAATATARTLRDQLRAAGFVVGLVADDSAYTELSGSVNPQGPTITSAMAAGSTPRSRAKCAPTGGGGPSSRRRSPRGRWR
jgi:hypothetical protein